MKLLARIFCFWFFASSWLLNQIESITHQEMGMFGNPQIPTHFYIYIYIFFNLSNERPEIKFSL